MDAASLQLKEDLENIAYNLHQDYRKQMFTTCFTIQLKEESQNEIQDTFTYILKSLYKPKKLVKEVRRGG